MEVGWLSYKFEICLFVWWHVNLNGEVISCQINSCRTVEDLVNLAPRDQGIDTFPKSMSTKLHVIFITNPSARAGFNTSLIKQSLTGLNSKFSFSKAVGHTKVKEPSLLNFLLFFIGRRIGYIPFQIVLAICEIKSSVSETWTCITVHIINDKSITLRVPAKT